MDLSTYVVQKLTQPESRRRRSSRIQEAVSIATTMMGQMLMVSNDNGIYKKKLFLKDKTIYMHILKERHQDAVIVSTSLLHNLIWH
ncbi:unnamed protein product [Cuscuta campestris]|uniref:Uncharacterized protein n=1 Tax=Cuscuta campestris TaxID=132261 RepID=A0A484KRW5_9ASTE|nr:unnamed protein product [Cuscuta campestris]